MNITSFPHEDTSKEEEGAWISFSSFEQGTGYLSLLYCCLLLPPAAIAFDMKENKSKLEEEKYPPPKENLRSSAGAKP